MILFAAAGAADYHILTDTAIWSGVVFVLLCLILGKLAWPAVAAAMRHREYAVVDSLRQAELARDEAQRLRDQRDQARARSRLQALALVEEAKRDAERVRVEHVARARSESERIRQRVEREITLARRKALDELWRRTTDLSAELAERLLQIRLSHDDHRRLVGQAIREIGQVAGARR
jgi:F-type H+-transporting ATPase subunit b